MSQPIIQVDSLGKSYLLGHESVGKEKYVALRDVVARQLKSFGRKAMDMFQGRQIIQGDEIEEFWALRNISFSVQPGEVVGVIGGNGAGKSTLLKILSRITEPTEGKVTLRGRVASLLEVGTGFHPELSGRENVYLNGAILGMSRREITNKFDEIVEFAEVERFLDTPVKRYSSGMYVRLAFAVAAHLDPEILVIDEVLAVGDAQFQKKCLGKMQDVARQQGRTVLFVSHNMSAIKILCQKGIVLSCGRVEYIGSTEDAIGHYYTTTRKDTNPTNGEITKKSEHNLDLGRFTKVFLRDDANSIRESFAFTEPVVIDFQYEGKPVEEDVVVSLVIKDTFGNSVLMGCTSDFYQPFQLKSRVTRFRFRVTENLMPGKYFVSLGISYFLSGSCLDWNEEVVSFSVEKMSQDGRWEYPWTTVHGSVKPKTKVEVVGNED